ncbi:MAG TPA: acetate--CoA ligase family protein [Patescibacteria group bacterium]
MEIKPNIKNLFNPKSIAIVGASEKEGKVGTVIAQNILNLGYKGEILLVNQSAETLYGQKCYASLKDIERPVDLAIVAVPAKFVMDVILDGKKLVKNFVIISAGFGETDDEGKKREQSLAKLAHLHDLTILGPNCLGFIVPALKLNASFAGGMPKAGNIAFVSQSGALAVALMDIAEQKRLGFSSIVSVGNKMQIDESLLLEYFMEDKKTKVIAMYLEGIKDGQKFIEIASRVSKKKSIVILKAGKNEKAQQAISSHTGALAGSDAIMDAAFEKAGVIRAENLEHFFDLIMLMSMTDALKTNKVGIITNAGGAGVLTTDAFENKRIALAEFSFSEQKKILSELPEESSAHNPVDVLGDAQEDRYAWATEVLQKNKEVSVILNILTPQEQTPVEKIAEEIIKASNKKKKIITASFVGGSRVDGAVEMLRDKGVPNFSFPEQAIDALDAYWTWHQNCKKKSSVLKLKKTDAKRSAKVAHVIDKARGEGRKALYYSEAAEIMKLYNIPVSDAATILPKQKAPDWENFPVILKIDSDKVLHKSDKQALIANIKDHAELEIALKKLRKNFPAERFIAQPMQKIQTELILGIKMDPIFGPVIVYGLGGIYTEIFKKVSFLIPPLDEKSILKSLENGPLEFLFKETRGQKAYNAKELAKIIMGLIAFSREAAHIREFDINPLFVYNDGRRASAVDVKIIF